MKDTTIYLVRHAHAHWQPDEARSLSQSGFKAARALAGLLASVPISAVYSSPAPRCIQTVAPLAERVGIRATLVPELRERELPIVRTEDFVRLIEDGWRHPEGAMEGGESNVSAQTRGLAVVRTIIRRHVGQHVVAATHGNLLTLILNGFDSTFGYDFWRGLSFPDVYRLEFDSNALICVERVWQEAAQEGVQRS